MVSTRVKPKPYSFGKGKTPRTAPLVNRKSSSAPIFNRLTVVWVQQNGVPFDTTGFFARLSRGNRLAATASFDRFGVVRFNTIETLTEVGYTLRLFSRDGRLFRVRLIPAGVETYAVIG
ncbi:MAG TPA: hypothetical protein VMS09_12490 [Paenibacillus sp.]|uniref:hypothetical protein n=1 Tax=Paenibacillus sp. TaxID=58172 RepID=UPI0028D8087E|nr:hypothetical protein [Paenibacillus sp.]HUC92824.1 hypothetical protein [Paenibacillus sp.]